MTEPRCRKRKYSKKGAEMALLSTRISRELNHNQRRKEKRIYYHRQCNAWHITSKELNNGKAMQEESERKESPISETNEA